MKINSPILTIDPKFRDLIPALSPEEYEQLETNCKADGILDPIKVWSSGNIILDGHNRYRIAKDHGLDFKIHTLFMPDREAAMNWIDENQLGRRNLDPDMMALVRGRIYNRTKQTHGGQLPGGKPQNGESLSTAKTLAPHLGVSKNTLERDGAFAAAVEKLDLAEEVTSNSLDAPRSKVIAAAKALPENPTPKQIEKAKASLEAPPAPKAKPTPKADPVVDPAEVTQLRARVKELEALVATRDEELRELAGMLKETVTDNESMARILDAEDLQAAFHGEVKRFKELARVTEARNVSLTYEVNDLKGMAKSWRGKFERLEKATKAAAPKEASA